MNLFVLVDVQSRSVSYRDPILTNNIFKMPNARRIIIKKGGTTNVVRRNKGVSKKIRSRSNMQQINVPVAFSYVSEGNRPTIVGGSNGSIIVKHSEFIENVALPGSVAQTDFKIDGHIINAANSNLFPWLSMVARNFEYYCIKKLLFRFQTAKKTTLDGNILLSIDYDVGDKRPRNESEMLMNRTAVGPIWGMAEIPFITSNLQFRKYLCSMPHESLDVGGYATQQMYHSGRFYHAITGVTQSVSQSYGKLMVDYEIELLVPTNSNDSSGTYTNTITVDDPDNLLTPNHIIGGDAPFKFALPDGEDGDNTDSNYLLEFIRPFAGVIEAVVEGTGLSAVHTDAVQFNVLKKGLAFAGLSSLSISSATKCARTLTGLFHTGQKLALYIPGIMTTATKLSLKFAPWLARDVSLETMAQYLIDTGITGTQIQVDGVLFPAT